MANEKVDNPVALVVTFFVVAALSLLTIALSFANMGIITLVFQLLIGTVQSVIMLRYFMHLDSNDTATKLTVAAATFWMFILFTLVLTDYLTRHYGSY